MIKATNLATATLAPLMLALLLTNGCQTNRTLTVQPAHNPDPQALSLAHEAWKAAGSISSPIHAGREQIAVAGRLAAAGWDERIMEQWAEKSVEAWVRAGVLAQAACGAAQRGEVERTRQLLAPAHKYAQWGGEWRRPMVMPLIDRTEAWLVLAGVGTNSTGNPQQDLAAWATTNLMERMSAAAWACAWATKQTDAAGSWRWVGKQSLALAALSLKPEERLKLMAMLAGQLPSEDQTICRQSLEAMLVLSNQVPAISARPFGLQARAAIVYAALGEKERAAQLLQEAQQELDKNNTGEIAPWAILADTLLAVGRTEEARTAFAKGLAEAPKQSGFNRQIALARTLAGMAVSGLTWSEAEVESARKAAK